MKAVIYYLSLPFIYSIALLPFWWIYRLSDVLFFIAYYLIGYRKDVVFSNLQKSFPQKSNKEIKKIQLRFYKYFVDLILEILKSLCISSRSLKKRIVFEDTSIFQKYMKKNQSVIIVMGHYGNWELGGARFALESIHKLYVVYHPLANQYFNRLIYKMRTRLGNGLYSMQNTIRGMLDNRKQLTATAFIADQTPSMESAYWINFLHQDTPFFKGTGKIAHKYNYPVIYASVNRTKRGRYTINIEELCPTPSELEPKEIMVMFTNKLEHQIKEKPEFWLWTHKRWKHKRKKANSQANA